MRRVRKLWAWLSIRFDPRVRNLYQEFWSDPVVGSVQRQMAAAWSEYEQARIAIEYVELGKSVEEIVV